MLAPTSAILESRPQLQEPLPCKRLSLKNLFAVGGSEDDSESDGETNTQNGIPMCSSRLLPTQESSRIGTTSVIDIPNLPKWQPIQIIEDVSGGCGGKTWEAASALARHLLHLHESSKYSDQSFFKRNKRIIELGSGTGIMGILVARLFLDACGSESTYGIPASIVEQDRPRIDITDMEYTLPIMRQNVALNCVEGEQKLINIGKLLWGIPLPEDYGETYDVILAADCVYLEIAFQPLIDTLVALSNENTLIIMCSKKRRKADRRFWMMLKKSFVVKEITEDPYLELNRKDSLSIVYARRKIR